MNRDDFDELAFGDDFDIKDIAIIFIALIMYIALSPIILTWLGCEKLYELIKNKFL